MKSWNLEEASIEKNLCFPRVFLIFWMEKYKKPMGFKVFEFSVILGKIIGNNTSFILS